MRKGYASSLLFVERPAFFFFSIGSWGLGVGKEMGVCSDITLGFQHPLSSETQSLGYRSFMKAGIFVKIPPALENRECGDVVQGLSASNMNFAVGPRCGFWP